MTAETISVKFKWHYLPVIMVILSFVKLIVIYVIAVMTDYVDPVFPYISTAASGYPQRAIFIFLAFVITVLLLSCVCVRFVLFRKVIAHFHTRDFANTSEKAAQQSNSSSNLQKKEDAEAGIPGNQSNRLPLRGAACRRANFVALVFGILETLSYIGVCGFPETVRSVRTVHTAWAILLFVFSLVYIVIDCALSYRLIKMHTNLRNANFTMLHTKIMPIRLIVVIFTGISCCIGMALLQMAADPLENHFEDLLRPKVRQNMNTTVAQRYLTTTSHEGIAISTSSAHWSNSETLQIVTAILEWIITLTVLFYFLTFYYDFKKMASSEDLRQQQANEEQIVELRNPQNSD